MKARIFVAQIAAGLALVAVSQTGACDCAPCPEQEPFESGTYEIIGLTHPSITMPEDQWLRDTVVGARVMVDREAGDVTIQYRKDGTTYQVHYTIEGPPP